MADMIEMKTLTIDDTTYEIVDETARESVQNHEHLFDRAVTTTGTGEAYEVAIDGITSLEVGISFTIIPHTESTTTRPTLNVNGLGAKRMYQKQASDTICTGTEPAIDGWITIESPTRVTYNGFGWFVDDPIVELDYTTGILPVSKGGTGATDEVGALTNLGAAPATHDHKFDDNVTGGSTNDTVAFWIEKGPGYCWISETGMIVNQPNQYGFLINYVNEGDVFQIFRDQTNARTYHRSGDNINGWFDSWAKVVTTNGDDVASTTTPGLVMVDGTAGIGVNTENGNLYIKEAETNEIDGKAHSYKPITPNNLDYAVKAGVTNNANTLSDAEKTAARQWIGAASTANAETWIFTLADGSTVSKEVILK